MKRFYTNKYPVIGCIYDEKAKENKDLPEGSIFTVSGISGDQFELKSVKKVEGLQTIWVGINMLESGFTLTDTID